MSAPRGMRRPKTLLEVASDIFPRFACGDRFGVTRFPSAHKGGLAKKYPETMGEPAGPSVSQSHPAGIQ